MPGLSVTDWRPGDTIPLGQDRTWFGRYVEAAGLSGYTMHQLRHAAIDQVRRATGDLEIARLLARHENVSVTQGYLHSTIDGLRAAIKGMGASV